MSANEIMRQIEDDRERFRREALTRRILDGLRATARLRPIKPEIDERDVYLEFTDESARFVAPLVEAVGILEAIIFASDGCQGHRNCVHSMEPWQRARALLQGKWEAECDGRQWPDSSRRELPPAVDAVDPQAPK